MEMLKKFNLNDYENGVFNMKCNTKEEFNFFVNMLSCNTNRKSHWFISGG